MKKIILVLFALLAVTLTSNVFSATKASDDVTVIDPYVRSVAPGQTVSAAFMQLENKSGVTRTVVNASSPVSKVVELHAHTHENGMMKMRRIEKMEIPANGKTVLEPGGLHIMLIGLHDELKLDQKVSLILEFSDGSSTSITAPVRDIMMKGMMPNMKKDMKH